MNPKRTQPLRGDHGLTIEEVRLVSDLRIMHAKVDELFQVMESLKERHDEGAIMPEHVHLLISEPEQHTASAVVQAIKLGFARRVLRSKDVVVVRVSHVSRFLRDVGNHFRPSKQADIGRNRIWQRRFYDFNVWTTRKRIKKVRYMHRNPVKRGLVNEPDQWTWSSFRAYMYGEPGVVRVNDSQILDKIDCSRR